MLVGIDVGGTFTDGVLLVGGEVARAVKRPTDEERLQETILAVLDELLEGQEASGLQRLVLSTTLVTNVLATGSGDATALLLIPGPGLNLRSMEQLPHTYIIDGAIDFRGRETRSLDEGQVEAAAAAAVEQGISRVAVVGKFSQRNNSHERRARELITGLFPALQVELGHEVSGQLNFPRRAATTYYTAMTRDRWSRFADAVEAAVRARGIVAPIDILKADGGTMPLAVSRRYPCETVFSGPAASAMGAFALTMDRQTSVVVDIGGTTSDLALILEGKPLHASKGAMIGGRLTHVRSFAVRSIPLGGDSAVRWQGGLTVGPDRQGVAACFGGPLPTPTDAFNLLEGGPLGEVERSRAALAQVAAAAGLTPEAVAGLVVDQVVGHLVWNVRDMFASWEQEPAYRVWEIVNRRKVSLDRVIGIGAAASAFVPELARRLECAPFIHRYSGVANALGACVARPTLSLHLHADTERGTYALDIDGISGSAAGLRQLADARQLAERHLLELARARGIESYASHREVFLEEQFNVIRGWNTVGKLFDVGVQIAPGVIDEFKGVPA
ncbi:MAG: hydantoinase/oxoprolinase family protein [Syntrophomonadaceae bacterium]|nr:hydantoinase/oxoprolinase family protein [Syntrophomonadaceae bacterium]